MASGEVIDEKCFKKNKEEEQYSWKDIPRRAISMKFKLVNVIPRYGRKWTSGISVPNPEGSGRQIQKKTYIQQKRILETKSDKVVHGANRSKMKSFLVIVLFQ